MHIRMVAESDVGDMFRVIREIYTISQYADGCAPLSIDHVSHTIAVSITNPEQFPCFVLDGDDEIGGILYGACYPNYFTGEGWYEERVFYIREKYRTYRNARQMILTAEEWCRERNVKRMEFGNAATRDHRISVLFERMGYGVINVTHAKRL